MKIGEISEQTGLGIHTIRYYEKQGLINKPEKDDSGHRNYSRLDTELLNWIACMKHSGMPLSKIQSYTSAVYNNNNAQCLALLQEHLHHLHQQRVQLDHYITVTETKINRLKKP
jgi:DNA-binding transcriptional MerR regulator